MALNANALTTVSRQKSFLGITSTTHDTVLELLINALSTHIENKTGRKFLRQTHTNELYNGKDSKSLYLKNFPVIQGQTFTLQQRNSAKNEDDWQTVDAEDYFIEYDSGRLVLTSISSFATAVTGQFDKGVQNWRVTYTAGYYLPQDTENFTSGADDSLPSDLEMLVWEWVGLVFNKRKTQGVQRQKVRDIEVWFESEISKDPILAGILAQYRRRNYG